MSIFRPIKRDREREEKGEWKCPDFVSTTGFIGSYVFVLYTIDNVPSACKLFNACEEAFEGNARIEHFLSEMRREISGGVRIQRDESVG